MKTSFAAGLCLVAAVVLCGCTTQPVSETQFYPDCHKPLDQVCRDRAEDKDMVGMAVLALAGAYDGALAGAAATDQTQGVLAAVAAAAKGAATGFLKARLDRIEDRTQRLEELKTMLGQEAANLDLEKASVLMSLRCYKRKMAVIAARLDAGRMTHEEASVRMLEIKTGVRTAETIWQERSAGFQSRMRAYEAYIAAQDGSTHKTTDRDLLARSSRGRASISHSLDRANDEVNAALTGTMDKLELMLGA